MNLRPLHDRLAAQYVLGTLTGGARRRVTTLLRDDTALRAHVGFWERAFMPLVCPLSAVPSPQVWAAIAARVAPRAPALQRQHWFERWFGVRTLASLSAGLVLGTALGVIAPNMLDRGVADRDGTQLPESYVGVLAGADGRAGLIVSSRRHGTVMDVKQIQPAFVNAGQTLFLWVIEADGTRRAIGALPAVETAAIKHHCP